MSFSSNQVTMNATMRITLCLCLLFAIADLAWGGACDGCSKRCSGQPGTCGWSCTCKSWAESTILCGYEYQPDWCDRIEPDSLRIEATTSELMSTLVSKYNNLDKTYTVGHKTDNRSLLHNRISTNPSQKQKKIFQVFFYLFFF